MNEKVHYGRVIPRDLQRKETPDAYQPVWRAPKIEPERMLSDLARTCRAWIVRTVFERRYGVSTDGMVFLQQFGLAGPDRIEYAPSNWTVLRRILPTREVSPEDVFVDFGSGKGRIVVQAATDYPFRRVIGVELAGPLHDVALANVENARPRLQCKDVRLVHSDALSFGIPDDVTVAYFYNPFTGKIFADVVRRLIESVDRSPRRLRIVYRHPEEELLLLNTGRVRLYRSRTDQRSPTVTRLYEIVPAA